MDLTGSWNFTTEKGVTGTVNLPCAYDGMGKIAFQRTVRLPADVVAKYRFHLVALGISQNAEITVNNDFITNHSGGYTTIQQTIPAQTIQPDQENVVRIVVNNQLDYLRSFPLRPFPGMPRNYGGIYREIYLLGTPETSISGAAVTAEYSPANGAAKVRVRMTVEGAAQATTPMVCWAELVDKTSGSSVARSTAQLVGQKDAHGALVEIAATGIRPWSPSSPDLYAVRCFLAPQGATVPTDEYDVTIGIRQINVANGRLQLNGARLQVRGVIWNEDAPGSGASLSDEQMERDVAHIKTLGANAIRFPHHPPHPVMLDLCDKYGLLVLEQLPVAGVPGSILAEEPYLEQATAMAHEMVARDANHPSVLAWGLGSDLAMGDPSTKAFLEKLAAVVRGLDGRPLYAVTAMLEEDVCTPLMDLAVVAMGNEDIKAFRTGLERWRGAHPVQPAIVGRFGCEVQPENRRGYNDPYSQEAQARFYLQRFDALKALDYDGAFLDSYNDWLGARPSLAVHSGNPLVHTYGLVGRDREKRLAFDAVRASLHGEKFAALPVGSYSDKAPIVFVLFGFAALLGMVYPYNVSRRFREGVNRSMMSPYNFFSDVRDGTGMPLWYSLLLGVGVSAGLGLVVASIAFHFRDNLAVDRMLSLLLVSDTVKALVARTIWSPFRAVLVVAAAVLAGLFLIGMVCFAVRILFRQRINLFHALTVALWSTAPFLLFIPIGMIAYRVMESPVYEVPLFLLLALVHCWVILRLLKGMSIVYDIPALRMYLGGIVVMIVLAALVVVYYDSTVSATTHLAFLYHLVTQSL